MILDRFTDSTVAYQGYGRGVDLDLIRQINLAATGGLKPALTFLFDLDPGQALNRHQRTHDRMESEGIAFMQRVREGYLVCARAEPLRFSVIDARLEVEEIAESIFAEFVKLK